MKRLMMLLVALSLVFGVAAPMASAAPKDAITVAKGKRCKKYKKVKVCKKFGKNKKGKKVCKKYTTKKKCDVMGKG
ncbi:MAG: hypothetical protein KC609_13390 [Myxococcales bacterium]|nr:hypothetical protein [Myxococcales bacterium]